MKAIVTIAACSLFSAAAFCQSSAPSQPATKQTATKQATTNTNKSVSAKTDRAINPNSNGTTWYYCQVCGHKYASAGKCPTDGTTLVAKTIK